MKDKAVATAREGRDAVPGSHVACLRIQAGPVSIDGEVAISTRGLMAVGAMVSGILLSVAAVVLVATRKLPEGTLPSGHRTG